MEVEPGEAPPRPRRTLNLSLSTALVGVAFAAVWLAYLATWFEYASLSAKIIPLRESARGLRLSKSDRLSAYRVPKRSDEYAVWQLEVPPQPTYELRLATRGIGLEGTASEFKAATLPPGAHTLEARHSGSMSGANAKATLNPDSRSGRLAITVDETADWYPQAGFTAGREPDVVEDHSLTQPLVLYRVRFHAPGTAQPPSGPANGVLLWIQPLEPDGQPDRRSPPKMD